MVRVWTNLGMDEAIEGMKWNGYEIETAIDLPDEKTEIHRIRWAHDTESLVLVQEGEGMYLENVQDAKMEGMYCPCHCYEMALVLSTNVEIMVGLNDKDTHQQEIGTDEALGMIGEIYQDCTIQECVGFYKGEKEKSFKVTVYGVPLKEAMDKAQETKRRFNQECVIVTEIKTQMSYFI